MACPLKSGLLAPDMNESLLKPERQGLPGFHPCFGSLGFGESRTKNLPLSKEGFLGKPVLVWGQKCSTEWHAAAAKNLSLRAQASICVSRSMRWWEKTLKPNMVEIHSAQEFVDSLRNAGDRLVVVDFYSPGCGGCRALHPKICQLAESSPDAVFLKVNYEQLKTMCHILHIHVLPFFRFYRGAEGRVCSFSCTVATIKKFKDALTKHGTGDRCGLGPTKGLDEAELMKLAAVGEISMDLSVPFVKKEGVEDLFMKGVDASGALQSLAIKEETLLC